MYYDLFKTGLIGTLTLAGDEAGLRHIMFEKEKNPIIIPDEWKKKPDFFASLRAQLRAYFKRELKHSDISLFYFQAAAAARLEPENRR